MTRLSSLRRPARLTVVLAVAVLGLTTAAGCGRNSEPAPSSSASPPPPGAANDFADALAKKVTVDATLGHLRSLQQIADQHGGNRALGTPGYDASVDFVVKTLRDRGFDVQTPEFEAKLPFADEPKLTVGGDTVGARALEYSVGSPAGGATGPLVAARIDDTPGCTPADYDGVATRGAVVLVDRGSCPFGVKQTAAAERGAVAMIVANNVDGEMSGSTLGGDTKVTIPVVAVSKADGARLRARPGTATTLALNAGVRVVKTRNVLAQTTTGSMSDVVMLGAHLDSVPEGPGVNDNGSGVAALLETAAQLGSAPQVRNAVRFGFWGGEELGLLGSSNYVESLDVDQLKDIALYLNFDMLGSPNPGYFTYDGNQSLPPDPRSAPPRVPEGSAGIERTLVAYLDRAGKPAQDTSFDGRSDYDGFTKAGVPAGGLFSGAEGDMTEEQARLWGGEAGAPYDPNYHKPTDTFDSIDRTAMQINGSGVAYAVGLYAQDETGRNGVPVRDDRTRHRLPAS